MTVCEDIRNCVTGMVIAPPANGDDSNLARSILNISAWTIASYFSVGASNVLAASLGGGAAFTGEIVGPLLAERPRPPIGISSDTDLQHDASLETLLDGWTEFERSVGWGQVESISNLIHLRSFLENANLDLQNMTNDEEGKLYEKLHAILRFDVSDSRDAEGYSEIQRNLLSIITLENIINHYPEIEEQLREAVGQLSGSEEATLLGSLINTDLEQLQSANDFIQRLDTEQFIQIAQDPFFLAWLGGAAGEYNSALNEGFTDEDLFSDGNLYGMLTPELGTELAGAPVMATIFFDLLNSQEALSIILAQITERTDLGAILDTLREDLDSLNEAFDSHLKAFNQLDGTVGELMRDISSVQADLATTKVDIYSRIANLASYSMNARVEALLGPNGGALSSDLDGGY